MTLQTGWYPDPVRRFAERYWDGEHWTDRVRTSTGHESTDPAPSADEIGAAVRRRAPGTNAPGSFHLPPGANRRRRTTPAAIATVLLLAIAATIWVVLT